MNLCIDIGNSKIKAALFETESGKQLEFFQRKKMSAEWLEEYLAKHPVEAAILSNTKEYDPAIDNVLKNLPVYIRLSHETPLPIKNHYLSPDTLGRDRLAAVCAASHLYPGQQVLVIDAGTCITLDMVNEKGEYFGGSIHPGLHMRFKALYNYTGKLPLVEKQSDISLIGRNTEESIRSGVMYAAAREIEGMINAYNVKFGELKVIITGGDASFFVSQMKSKIFAHSNLVLSGLNKILMYNVEKLK